MIERIGAGCYEAFCGGRWEKREERVDRMDDVDSKGVLVWAYIDF